MLSFSFFLLSLQGWARPLECPALGPGMVALTSGADVSKLTSAAKGTRQWPLPAVVEAADLCLGPGGDWL